MLGVSAMACTSVCKAREEEEIKAFMVFAIDGWISLIELKEIFLMLFCCSCKLCDLQTPWKVMRMLLSPRPRVKT